MKERAIEICQKVGDINGRGKEMLLTHCRVVAAIALEVARAYQEKTGQSLDLDLIEAGAMIHDVGWLGIKIEKAITHGEAGYQWLKENGYPEELARFCLTHGGVGLTTEETKEISALNPELDHMPQTMEEIIVAYADKFTSKGTNCLYINPLEEIEADIKGYGGNKFSRWQEWKEKLGMPDLSEAKKIVEEFNINH